MFLRRISIQCVNLIEQPTRPESFFQPFNPLFGYRRILLRPLSLNIRNGLIVIFFR